MRTEIPETPQYWDGLERALSQRVTQPRRRRFSFPVSLTAIRALRTFTRHAVHSLAVVSLAAVMVLTWSEPIGETATVQINAAPDQPAYIAQFSPSTPRPSAVQQARNSGYEVAVQRMFTTDPAMNGRILSQRHPGEVVVDKARGPMLFVIGYTIGDNSILAN